MCHDEVGTYSKFTGTMMRSFFANTKSKVVMHVIADNCLTDENRKKFQQIADEFNQTIIIYNADEKVPQLVDRLKKSFKWANEKRFTIGCAYGLIIQDVIDSDVEKVIVVGSDMICNLDIKELWDIDLQGKWCAVGPSSNYSGKSSQPVEDLLAVKAGLVRAEDYFNNGSIVLNLDRIRRENVDFISEGAKLFEKYPNLPAADQDIMNVLFSKDYVKVSKKYNTIVQHQRDNNIFELEPAIYHYVDRCLNLDTSDPYNRLFFEHYTKTPFFNLDIFSRLYNKINQSLDDSRMTLIRYSIFSANKKRLFVIYKDDANRIGKIFNTNDNDMIMAVDRNAPTLEVAKALINYLSQHRNEFFSIVALGYNRFSSESAALSGEIIYPMRQAGFEYGRDFIFDIDILPRNLGGVFEKSFYYVNPL